MTAKEIMKELYPGMPQHQLDANAQWLRDQAKLIKVGGYIMRPRDLWIIRKLGEDVYEIVFRTI